MTCLFDVTKILTMFPVVKNTFPELAYVVAIHKSILFIYCIIIIIINYVSYNLLLQQIFTC